MISGSDYKRRKFKTKTVNFLRTKSISSTILRKRAAKILKKNMKNKTVYIALSVDVLHHGHINLINHAKKYGKVIAGLLTDSAISSQKRIPLLDYNQRKKILENISGISKVVPQTEWEYSKNILKLKPDYMVHGDDWINGRDKYLRNGTIKALKKVGGKLIEIPQ